MFQLKKTEFLIISLLAWFGWITFLFVDVFSQAHVNHPHFVAQAEISAPTDTLALNANTAMVDDFGIQEEILDADLQEELEQSLNISNADLNDIKINSLQADTDSIAEDINILKTLYNKQHDAQLLYILIQKLAQNYQFDEAKLYADEIIQTSGLQNIDIHIYLQSYLNSSEISVLKLSSIEKVKPVIEEARLRWLLSTDDYRFYQLLVALWYRDYSTAETLLKQIDSPRYSTFVDHMNHIWGAVAQQRDMPSYYQDALISLNLLKHGYFSLAKKISLDVLKEDDSYILPYQILAYAHFLTNNWDTAIEYLLKLENYDPHNEYLYKFLLGVSYHRLGKYEQSVIQFSQIEQAVLDDNTDGFNPRAVLTDSYRYLLLNYQELQDSERMLSIWKKLLGQPQLEKSDFYVYFYEVLFRPFVEGENYSLYRADPQLAKDFVDRCETTLVDEDEDVCSYGDAGLLMLMGYHQEAKNKLLYIAKNYPQSYIFHSLGDFYAQQNDLDKAKKYYIKAISMPHNNYEESVLKNKLTEFATQF